MARPSKRGLDYFPMDINIFREEKLLDVQNKYGSIGESVYLHLLCLVYEYGYYYQFKDLDKLSATILHDLGRCYVQDKKEIREIIELLIESELFSKEMAEQNILTSRGIQKRYWAATERRRGLRIVEYSLIDDIIKADNAAKKCCLPSNNTGVSAHKNGVIADNNSKNACDNEQSKVKESKVEESKEKESRVEESKVKESRVEESRVEESKVASVQNAAQLGTTTTTNDAIELNIPCADKGGIYSVTVSKIQELQQIYPKVNVRQSLFHLSRYLVHHASKRRCYDDMAAYCEMWLRGDEEQGKCPRIDQFGGVYDLRTYENIDPFADMMFDEDGNITEFSQSPKRF